MQDDSQMVYEKLIENAGITQSHGLVLCFQS